jgi:chemotaxis methyl-accepting protein methylase
MADELKTLRLASALELAVTMAFHGEYTFEELAQEVLSILAEAGVEVTTLPLA